MGSVANITDIRNMSDALEMKKKKKSANEKKMRKWKFLKINFQFTWFVNGGITASHDIACVCCVNLEDDSSDHIIKKLKQELENLSA